MSNLAVRVENLGKSYRVTHHTAAGKYKTLQEEILNWVRRPFSARLDKERIEQFWALQDVSFELKVGESLGIIGRNGAGKSTLLKILSRITHPTIGFAAVRGRVGSLLEVGTGFHPELTGRENVFLNGAILGMRRRDIQQRFDEIVAFAEVEKFLDMPVKRYSSGMYMRLAFSVAAHLEPEVLVVDEVLAVGDVAFQKKCLGHMGKIASEGRTVLFVSHNMAAVRSLCSSAMLLESGQVKMHGAVEATIATYLSGISSEMSSTIALPASSGEASGEGICLRFFAQNGEARAQFRIGEKWRVVLDFELKRPVLHCIAALGLVTLEAIPVTTVWSLPQDLEAGRYQVSFDVDLPLGVSQLVFTVGLSSFEQTFYYVESTGQVTISEVAAGEQPVRASGAGLLISPQSARIEALN